MSVSFEVEKINESLNEGQDFRTDMLHIQYGMAEIQTCHVHVWFEDKIILWVHRIDSIIIVEMLDPAVDPEHYDVVKILMSHGSWGALNTQSPWIEENQSTNQYLKSFLSEITTSDHRYPKYHHFMCEFIWEMKHHLLIIGESI